MRTNGRNGPVVKVHYAEDGGLVVRVDFERDPAAWVEVTLSKEDLAELEFQAAQDAADADQ